MPKSKAKAKKSIRRKFKKVVFVLSCFLSTLLVAVIAVYIMRFEIAQWGLDRHHMKEKIQTEIKNSFMAEITPKLREEIKLTFLQRVGVFITKKRNEEQREKDAIHAVNQFITKQLKQEKLGAMVAGKLKKIDPEAYEKHEKFLNQYFIAIVWKYSEEKHDVVAAVNVSLKNGGSVTEKAVNANALFFKKIAKVAENAARGD